MQKKIHNGKKCISVLIVFVLFLQACEKENFSVNSNKNEEVTIVYGLLNPDENEHFIKIYKGFLTEDNAFEAAKNIDNYSFIDSIDVLINEYDGSKLVRSLVLDTTSKIAKDSGIFAYPFQILYTAVAKLNLNYKYELVITNRYTGKITKAETNIVDNISITKPILTLNKELSMGEDSYNLVYTAGNYISCYDAYLNFYYTEELKDGTSRQGKPVCWHLGQDMGKVIKNEIPYSGATFYKKISDGIKNDENVKSRHTDSITIVIYKGAEDFYKYLLASSVNTGLNQERLVYTNIRSYASLADAKKNKEDGNGLGLFSSKGCTSIKFRDLSLNSRDSLFDGRYTKHLKFTDIY